MASRVRAAPTSLPDLPAETQVEIVTSRTVPPQRRGVPGTADRPPIVRAQSNVARDLGNFPSPSRHALCRPPRRHAPPGRHRRRRTSHPAQLGPGGTGEGGGTRPSRGSFRSRPSLRFRDGRAVPVASQPRLFSEPHFIGSSERRPRPQADEPVAVFRDLPALRSGRRHGVRAGSRSALTWLPPHSEDRRDTSARCLSRPSDGGRHFRPSYPQQPTSRDLGVPLA